MKNQQQTNDVENTINKVIEQIKTDISFGDTTAIAELLLNVPTDILEAYLPETM